MEKILDAILVLFGVILLTGILMIWFRPDASKNYKYTIDMHMPNLSNHYTNHYICNGSCVRFKDSKGDTMTVCSNYSIITNK